VFRGYDDFLLLATEVGDADHGRRRVAVRVPLTPSAGESIEASVQALPPNLRGYLEGLEKRSLALPELIELGELLAGILFPPSVRDLLVRSLDNLSLDQGLRVRLQLTPSLFSIPWEYAYLQRAGAEKDALGFLALEPRISIVRHQPFPAPARLDLSPRPRRLLAIMVSPDSEQYARLDLTHEREILESIQDEVSGLSVDFLDQATVEHLRNALSTGADIVHFAGHGDFARTGLGTRPFSSVGRGVIVLTTDDNRPDLVPADQFAVNLGGRGVQLVVLGACQTGRRDSENVWSSVVSALMENGIPAAVAMQNTIHNESALLFGRSLYRALAAGSILDEAVCAGRLAVFNRWHAFREDPQQRGYWRDWGVPVLYLRPQQDLVLPAMVQPVERSRAAIPDEERSFLEAELSQHRRNELRLRRQKAVFAEGEAPLRLLNQIDAERQEILELEQRLSN
jgi:hypothetical protein